MKTVISTLFFAIACLSAGLSTAGEAHDVTNAQRFVVITADEGIHYAKFCGFFELRELLASNVGNATVSISAPSRALYEIRMLGRGGEAVVHIGDHWIESSKGVALLPSATFERIVEMVDHRKGSGVPKRKIEASVRQALKRIQRPGYVEENGCPSRYAQSQAGG